MPSFGKKSNDRLNECHEDLQKIMNRVVMFRDCSVVCGVRGKKEQNQQFKEGNSKLQWPLSKHNITHDHPIATAVDIVPWPEQYNDPVVMIFLAGMVIAVAKEMYVRGEIDHMVRWGGDWDQDGDFNDETFKDLWHFELIEE